MLNKLLALPFVLILLSTFTVADVAPPEGQVSVTRGLVLWTDQDLSDHRFFIVSDNLLQEVLPVKGQFTAVPSLGGGARYSTGVLYAVPRKAVAAFPNELSQQQSEDLASALKQGKMPRSIELLRHGFTAVVPAADEHKVTPVQYQLSKTGDGGIKAVKYPGAEASSNPARPSSAIVSAQTEGHNNEGYLPVAAGLLMTAGVIGVGVLVIRSRRKDAA